MMKHAEVAPRPLWNPLLGVLLVAGLMVTSGCEDNSGVPAAVCIGFTPAAGPEPGTVATRLVEDSVCEELAVDLVVTDVDDVFGFNTTVRYNAAGISWAGYDTIGTVLQQDGADMIPVIREVAAGQVEVGMDRLSDTGVDVSGTAFLVRLRFVVSSASAVSGQLTLDEGCLWDSDSGAEGEPAPMDGVACVGGSLFTR